MGKLSLRWRNYPRVPRLGQYKKVLIKESQRIKSRRRQYNDRSRGWSDTIAGFEMECENILKEAREKQQITYRGPMITNVSEFILSEAM